MRSLKFFGLLSVLAISTVADRLAHAQNAAETQVLKIWPAAAPGTTDWTGPEIAGSREGPNGVRIEGVTNVTIPTLTVFRPAPGIANGTAMIVAPGGAFAGLATKHEGTDIAQWLAARGITAFVLKYRVQLYPIELVPDARHHPEQFAAQSKLMEPKRRIAVADGIQAVHYLRANATKLGIRADRIGFMGFSAGAATTMGTVLDSAPPDRPDLAAPIYGEMEDILPQADAPPLFIVAAQDDPVIPVSKSIDIFTKWTAADRPAELHVYEQGGHGFGANKQGKPIDDWLAPFAAWLMDHGWLAKPLASERRIP